MFIEIYGGICCDRGFTGFCAQAEKCLVDGAAEGLQMLDVAAFITRRYIGLQLA